MKELLEAYMVERNDSWNTTYRRRFIILDFLEYLARQGLALAECRREHFDDYHQSLLWRPLSSGGLWSVNTVDQALRMTRAFLRWALARGHLKEDATRGLTWGRPPQPPQSRLDRNEIQRLLTIPNLATPPGMRDQALLELIYTLGFNFKQCQDLNLEDSPDRFPEGSARAAVLHYLARARHRLANPDERALFVHNRGGRISEVTMRQLFKYYGGRIGYKTLSPRDLHRAAKAHREQFHSNRFSQ